MNDENISVALVGIACCLCDIWLQWFCLVKSKKLELHHLIAF